MSQTVIAYDGRTSNKPIEQPKVNTMQPNGPAPDSYHGHPLVAPNFSFTPDLTPVIEAYEKHGVHPRQSELWRIIAPRVERKLRDLYRTSTLTRCPTFGLYIAGSEREVSRPDRERMMVLVFEMQEGEINRWRDVDEALKNILERNGLRPQRGVCIRYYMQRNHHARQTERDAPQLWHYSGPVGTTSRYPSPLIPRVVDELLARPGPGATGGGWENVQYPPGSPWLPREQGIAPNGRERGSFRAYVEYFEAAAHARELEVEQNAPSGGAQPRVRPERPQPAIGFR